MQIGKCIKDIPINKIYEGMKFTTGSMGGKIIKTISKSINEINYNFLILEWDDAVTVRVHQYCNDIYFSEENK